MQNDLFIINVVPFFQLMNDTINVKSKKFHPARESEMFFDFNYPFHVKDRKLLNHSQALKENVFCRRKAEL